MNAPDPVRTSQLSVSSAQICRDQGWVVGDLLETIERASKPRTGPLFQARLTAIGQRLVLCDMLKFQGQEINPHECLWPARTYDWMKV